MRFKAFGAATRRLMDTRLGFILATDSGKVLHEDGHITTYAVRLSIALLWVTFGVEVYL